MKTRLAAAISFFLLTTAIVAREKTNTLGLRIGLLKNTYSDASFNFKTYHGSVFHPLQIRFERNTGKNTSIAGVTYISNTLKPATGDNFVLSDEIAYRSAALDFSYLHQFFTVTGKLNLSFGAKTSVEGFTANRSFRKTFNALSGKQDSYDITYFSLAASGRIQYTVSESAWFSGTFDVPLLALNLKNYNPEIDPKHQDLWLCSIDKYAGFSGDVAFVKKVNRFSFEIYHAFQFTEYKTPYTRKRLTNKTGLGICYEF